MIYFLNVIKLCINYSNYYCFRISQHYISNNLYDQFVQSLIEVLSMEVCT